MPIYFALFRGINVGGKNLLPMKTLTELMEREGFVETKTYIQSGNVLFKSSTAEAKRFAKVLGKAIQMSRGFEPDIFVLSLSELEDAVHANPFPADNPKALHLYFLAQVPEKPDFEGLNKVKVPSERFELIGKVFYLYAPEGIGRSKLAAKVEKQMGVKATARNWATVTALLQMA